MVKCYDIGVKKLIEVFANNIKVIGLASDDSSPEFENVFTQAGQDSPDGKLPFPIISVFRNPEIEITDGSMTKRASSAEGYTEVDSLQGLANSLVIMRTTLTYTVDVFDVAKASAEEIAIKLYWRLRNNPEIKVIFDIPEIDKSFVSVADLELDPSITNAATPALDKTQLYKIRFSFKLVNANILDILSREIPREIRWTVTAELE